MADTGPFLKRRDLLLAGGAACAVSGLALSLRPGTPAVARDASPTQRIAGRAFGTDWRVNLPAGGDDPVLRRELDRLLAGIDAEMSPWRSDSRLSAVNRAIAGPQPISAEFAHVTQAALNLADVTKGAFDPTVGPAVSRWGFGPIDTQAATGWRGMTLEGDRVTKTDARLTLDLCGIAKGRALDRMGALLADMGHADFLVDLGGELLARGRHPSGRVWRVGIEDPRPGRSGLAGTIALRDRTIATSGIKANGYQSGTRRYSHIIDPMTMSPIQGALASVSVLSRDAMTADGWATALMAAGDSGPDLARRHRIDALFLFAQADGLRPEVSGQFEFRLG